MPRQPVFCYGHNQSVTDAYSVKACTKDVANEANSNNFPRKGTISHVEGEVSAIAGGALNAIWFLAWDAAGDRPLFPAFTSLITVGATTATKGGFSATVGIEYTIPDDAVAKTIYMVAKSDVAASTFTMATRVFVER